MKTVRLDQLLMQRGLLESREKARRVVLAGQVRVNGVLATKPGRSFAEDVTLEVIGGARFVSRAETNWKARLSSLSWMCRGWSRWMWGRQQVVLRIAAAAWCGEGVRGRRRKRAAALEITDRRAGGGDGTV